MEAGDLILCLLEKIGVEYVFGIPGGAIEPLYNAMARSERRGGIRPVVTRHEAGAAFMADGYTQQTGKLGVCCATTGPGTTNLITGVAAAYENNVPMLVLTAQTPLPTFGRGAFQESSCTGVDTVGMFQYCTRYNSLVSHVEQLQHKLISAIMTAFKAPMGPVHLSLPLDVLRQTVQQSNIHFDLEKLLRNDSSIDAAAINELSEEVTKARHIVLVLGNGSGHAIGAITQFAEKHQASIVTTPHGKGLINTSHPLYRGVIGFAGHTSAIQTLRRPDTDLIIAVDTNLSEWASSGWDQQSLLNERLVHVDSNKENLTRSPMAKLHVTGDVLQTFELLFKICEFQAPEKIKTTQAVQEEGFAVNDEAKCYSNATPIKPQRLMHELNNRFPASTRFFADTGNSVAWAVHYLQPKNRRSTLLRKFSSGLLRTAIEFSSMGWAIGAAIGAAMGYRDGPVVCITGDGSFLMNGSELTVAVAEQLNVIFIILNDASLGMVKHGQRLSGAEQVGYQLPEVDFSAIAQAMGAQGYTINSPKDLENLDIEAMCACKGPSVLDVYVDGEEVPPMKMRIEGLNQVQGPSK
jgi:acetolactate synthase-1/2/3 large subunit